MPKKEKKKHATIKYPKFTLLVATYLFAFFIISSRGTFLPSVPISSVDGFGAFFLGMLYSYGFTASSATAAFLFIAKNQQIFLTAIIAGFGSLSSDFLVFKFIRHSFEDEIALLSRENIVANLSNGTPNSIKNFVLPVFGMIIIASPLPDEIGVFLLATSKIHERPFVVVSYLLNTTGILVILAKGSGVI